MFKLVTRTVGALGIGVGALMIAVGGAGATHGDGTYTCVGKVVHTVFAPDVSSVTPEFDTAVFTYNGVDLTWHRGGPVPSFDVADQLPAHFNITGTYSGAPSPGHPNGAFAGPSAVPITIVGSVPACEPDESTTPTAPPTTQPPTTPPTTAPSTTVPDQSTTTQPPHAVTSTTAPPVLPPTGKSENVALGLGLIALSGGTILGGEARRKTVKA